MRDQFKKYIWIVNQLYTTGGITFKELAEKWLDSWMNDDKTKLSKRSFDDYKKSISDAFDIDIICDASRGYTYRIDPSTDLKQSAIKSWLFNSFAVNNLLQESKNLSDRVVFEEIPSGNEHLMNILKAMQKNRVLELNYKDYYDTEVRHVFVMPYCVRAFRKRWYLVGPEGEGQRINRYALDRIISLAPTEREFAMSVGFSVEEYYKDAFGVIVDPEDFDVEDVKVKVYDLTHKRDYFRSLPIHPSQREVETCGDFSVFAYRLMPSYDFMQEIISHGEEVEILEPDYLRDEMRERVELMLKLYI
ncbi:MAG: WYL domain-containing protein [Paludibacteraceae bacterium]|nr:WYL domain-containing protein [Paludibacteraceae bacterium]